MSRKPCSFINRPGGCREGNRCRFAHTSNQSRPDSTPPVSSASQRNRQSPQTHTLHAGPPAAVPHGVCRSYWTTGHCNFGFSCRYKHEHGSPSSTSTTTPFQDQPQNMTRASAAASIAPSVAPFLTEDGLTKLDGTATDGFFSPGQLSPDETHNSIKRFLYDDYRFRITFDVYGFLAALYNASAANASWVSSSIIYHTTLTNFHSTPPRRQFKMDRFVPRSL
jgi:hypothetical protein